jgi:hypothetical protein
VTAPPPAPRRKAGRARAGPAASPDVRQTRTPIHLSRYCARLRPSSDPGLASPHTETPAVGRRVRPLQSLPRAPPPAATSVQSQSLPRVGAWQQGQVCSRGGGGALPTAHIAASLPACAFGVLPPRDGGSEKFGVAERNLFVQVLSRRWKGPGTERGWRGRERCGSTSGAGLACVAFPCPPRPRPRSRGAPFSLVHF